jgi:hypothetical protein
MLDPNELGLAGKRCSDASPLHVAETRTVAKRVIDTYAITSPQRSTRRTHPAQPQGRSR